VSTATSTMTRRPDALTAIAAGYRTQRDILAQTGRSEHAVVAELQHQIDQGCLTRTWLGRYRITEYGRQVLLARFMRAPRIAA
jgi:predicted transcriptional regulator